MWNSLNMFEKWHRISQNRMHLLSCHHLATILPPSCHHLATILPPSCYHLATMAGYLAPCWWQVGHDLRMVNLMAHLNRPFSTQSNVNRSSRCRSNAVRWPLTQRLTPLWLSWNSITVPEPTSSPPRSQLFWRPATSTGHSLQNVENSVDDNSWQVQNSVNDLRWS